MAESSVTSTNVRDTDTLPEDLGTANTSPPAPMPTDAWRAHRHRSRLIDVAIMALIFLTAFVTYLSGVEETAFHQDESRWINTPGQSGDLAAPHGQDLAPLWAAGAYVPMAYSEAAVAAATATTWTLRPAGGG